MTLAFYGKSRRHRGVLALLVLVTLMAAVAAGAFSVRQRAEASTGSTGTHSDSGYTVTSTFNAATSTWTYTVMYEGGSHPSPSISHFMLAICADVEKTAWDPDADEKGKDGSTGFPEVGSGLIGYKWNVNSGWTFPVVISLTLPGYVNDPTGAEGLVKPGTNHEHFPNLDGPDCTPPEDGNLKVKKIVVGDATGAPAFTGTVSGLNDLWSLTNGTNTGTLYDGIPAGAYTVAEDDPTAPWTRLGYLVASSEGECPTDGEPTTYDSTGASVDAAVAEGGTTWVCVYNTKLEGSIQVFKIVTNVVDDQTEFEAAVDGGTGFAFSEFTPSAVQPVSVGSHNVVETSGPGYNYLGYATPGPGGTCPAEPTSTATTATVDVADGETEVVCFYNALGDPLLVNKDAAGTYDREVTWTIEKLLRTGADPFADGPVVLNLQDGGPPAGVGYQVSVDKTEEIKNISVTGSISITNSNSFDIEITSVSDQLSDGTVAIVTCSGWDQSSAHTLAAGATLNCTYSATPPTIVGLTNTVTVNAGNYTNDYTTGTIGFAETLIGSDTINVTDAFDDEAPVALGAASADKTFDTYTRNFDCSAARYNEFGFWSDDYPNTAEITETGQQDSELVTVNCQLPLNDLEISKTGTGLYDTRHTWTIDKTVDPAVINLIDTASESGTANYTVTVDKTTTEENFRVGGLITITNPNAIGVTIHSLGDVLTGSVSAVVAGCEDDQQVAFAIPGTLGAGETITCAYSASGLGGRTGIQNTATVNAGPDNAQGNSTTIPITSWTEDQEFGYDTITVDDDNDEKGTDTLGATSSDATYEYSHDYTCEGVDYQGGATGSKVIDNTATITETVQWDDASVTVNCRRPELTLVKEVSGGDATANAFTLAIDGHGSNPGTHSAFVLAGESYGISETSVDGYYLLSLVCEYTDEAGAKQTIAVTQAATSAVTMPATGEDVTCTFTNQALGKITIVKEVVGALNDTFLFNVTPSVPPKTFGLQGGEDETWSSQAGDYTVTEATKSGWELVSIVCENATSTTAPHWTVALASNNVTINLADGDDITCTFTNEPRGSVTVVKYHDLDGNGQQDAGEPVLPGWDMDLEDDQGAPIADGITDANGEVTFSDLPMGDYTVCETLQSGWRNTDPGNDATPCKSVTLDEAGEGQTVYLGNQELGTVIIKKVMVNDPADDTGFTADVSGPSGQNDVDFSQGADGEIQDAIPGGYASTEDAPSSAFTYLFGAVGSYPDGAECPDPDNLEVDFFADDEAVAGTLEPGGTLVFCHYNEATARIIVKKVYEDIDQGLLGATRDQPGVKVDGQDATPNGLFEWNPVTVAANTDIPVEEILKANWAFVSVTGVLASDGETICYSEPDPVQETADQISEAFSILGINGFLGDYGVYANVPPGDTCVVTFTNEAYGTVVVEKIDQSANGQEWDFSVNGPQFSDTPHITGSDSVTYLAMPLGSYNAAETTAGIRGSIEQCPFPNPNGEGTYVTAVTPTTQSLSQPGQTITFTFLNQDCSVVLGSGSLVIMKWSDLDGDGEKDAGEPMLPGWTFNVAGPEFPGGQQFVTDGSGRIILNGITAGFYTVTEQQQSGWAQTGLIIGGVSQPVSLTAVVEVTAGVSETDLPLVEVEFGNRAQSTVRVIKVVNDQVGTRNRAGWQFNLAGCGTSINGVTDANGEITWSNLAPADNCAYTVTEVDTEGFTVAPAQAQVVSPGPGETATVTFTNSRIPGETPTPTPPTPTATPTNTPSPTPTPTNTPEPTETVAGERTPGPGNIATPIPPDTGSGLMGAGTAGNLLMALIGLMAISGGMALFSLGRKRR